MSEISASLFGKGFLKLEAALSARERMQSVFSANIANADTPNYRADQRNFADFLTARQQSQGHDGMARTQPGHMSINNSPSLQRTVFKRSDATQRMDGNSVNMQKEMTGMAENQLMHELTIRLLKGRLEGMKNTIREGGR